MTIRTANIVIVVMKEKNVHKVEALILPERDVPNSGEGKGNRENNRQMKKISINERTLLLVQRQQLKKQSVAAKSSMKTVIITKIRTNGETLKSASCEDCPDEKGKVDASNSWSAMKIAISEANAQFIALCHIEQR